MKMRSSVYLKYILELNWHEIYTDGLDLGKQGLNLSLSVSLPVLQVEWRQTWSSLSVSQAKSPCSYLHFTTRQTPQWAALTGLLHCNDTHGMIETEDTTLSPALYRSISICSLMFLSFSLSFSLLGWSCRIPILSQSSGWPLKQFASERGD